MEKEKIEKLLDAPFYQDVLLGIEYIRKNYTREAFEEEFMKGPQKMLKRDTMCSPPEDTIIIWEGVYYVWDGYEIWRAGNDPGVVMDGDVIINL